MKIYFFGTCSGTQPKPGRHHVAFAIELPNGVYWFDAGENCSYTAHLMGVDLLRVRAVFISHCHMDHVGGLGNLLWNIRKQTYVRKCQPLAENIVVNIPVRETFDGVMMILRNSEGNFKTAYETTAHIVDDSFYYASDVDDIIVNAVHNHHLPHNDGEPWKSFSYIIKSEGKRIVFSGDTALTDLPTMLTEETDLFLMETGHHTVSGVCDCIAEHKLPVRRLYFIHHGNKVMDDIEQAYTDARSGFNGEVCFCDDATTIEL